MHILLKAKLCKGLHQGIVNIFAFFILNSENMKYVFYLKMDSELSKQISDWWSVPE